jgi:5-methylcytosine-specific restriction endonuclease McrA
MTAAVSMPTLREQREYNRAYYVAHRDPAIRDRIPMTPAERKARKAASDRAYREANLERVRAYSAAIYRRDRDKLAAQDRARRLADPEAARIKATEASRRFRLRHPERMRAHRQAWLDEVPLREAATRCSATANRRARMYGADGQIGYETVLALWQRQPDCVDCGDGRGLDHVIPFALGGTNTSGNLANRCRSCNARKGTKLVEVAA